MRVAEGKVTILTLLLNPDGTSRDFRLPPPWLPSRIILDSAVPDAREHVLAGHDVHVAAHSVVLVYAEHA